MRAPDVPHGRHVDRIALTLLPRVQRRSRRSRRPGRASSSSRTSRCTVRPPPPPAVPPPRAALSLFPVRASAGCALSARAAAGGQCDAAFVVVRRGRVGDRQRRPDEAPRHGHVQVRRQHVRGAYRSAAALRLRCWPAEPADGPQGAWKDDTMDGQGKFTFASGAVYEVRRRTSPPPPPPPPPPAPGALSAGGFRRARGRTTSSWAMGSTRGATRHPTAGGGRTISARPCRRREPAAAAT